MPPKTRKVDNGSAAVTAKVEIRRRVLEALTPSRTVVFDLFAGPGVMWQEVWRQAQGYVGCDQRWFHDERCCYVADNRRVLRCLDLARFTCFDLDAYGSPWEQALIIAGRRRVLPGERVGVVLTDGAPNRSQSNAMLRCAGLSPTLRQKVGPMHLEVSERAVHGLVRRLRARVVHHWRAIGEGQRMRYVGLVVEGVPR